MKYVNIHDLEFKIDTMDWHNTNDASLVADDIETQMRVWTQEQAKKYDHPELKAVDEMCCECASKILDTYLDTSHMTGHNYSVYAG